MMSFLAEAEQRKFKSQYIVRNWGTSSHRLSVCESRTAELRDIVYSLCGTETAELQVTGYSLCGGGTARLKVKALVWTRNCETSSRTKFIVWKRNCVNSKPQYFPCAEAELRHFRGPSHTLFCMRKRNCGTLSLSIFLMRRRNFKPKNSPCVEAELQNWDCFSLLRSYQAWSNQLTCDKDPDIRQTSRPKTAGTKLPKGPISLDEGDFLTLQEGPRKGFSPELPRALAGAYWLWHAECGSHVF